MAFTLSHAAAALPFRKFLGGRLPFYALVAGTFSPDFGYFWGLGPYFTENSHTFYRSFTFCLPIGFFLLFLFCLLQKGFLQLIPNGIARVIRDLDHSDHWKPAYLPVTALAILMGSWTHIAWDSMTHWDGYMVENFALLRWKIFESLPLYRFLQHSSTMGGAWLLYRFLQLECRKINEEIRWEYSSRWFYWIGFSAGSALITALTLTAEWNYWLAFNDRRLPFLFVISLVRNFFVLVVLAALVLQLRGGNRNT